MDQSTINYEVYEDGTMLYGTAQVTLPDVSYLTQAISGAGISGNLEAVILGHIEAMTLGINFRNTTSYSIQLSEPRLHNLDLRIAREDENAAAGTLDVVPIKHIFVAIPKSDKGGTAAPATPTNGSGEYAVHYWATYIDGKKVREIDPRNFICEINGVDYLADVRKALGR